MKRLSFLVGLATLLISLGWLGSRDPMNPLKAAELAFRQGDYLRTVQIYDAMQPTLADPGHASFNRAAALYELGALDQAASDFQAASLSGDSLRSARSSYDLGNCALRQACEGQVRPNAKLLEQAISHYEHCLAQSAGGDENLSADAWHNQELARRLLRRSQPPAQAASKPRADDECEH